MRTCRWLCVLVLATALGCAGEVREEMDDGVRLVPEHETPVVPAPEPVATKARARRLAAADQPGRAPVRSFVDLGGQPFTIAVLPDTQFYAQSFPEIFEAQTRWIAKNRESQKIAFVLHEGDMVQDPDRNVEWQRASRAMRVLDGVVPYALARGNHDLAGGRSRASGLMDEYFAPSTYARYPWFRETFQSGRIGNSFLLVRAGSQNWVVLALEFGANDAALAWADGVLKRYADLPAIVVTHAYLYGDDNRYDRERFPNQAHSPHELQLEGGVNDGEQMWQKLISKHDNVLFVLSGHVTDDGIGRLTSERASGSKCHQLLANFQFQGTGGDGYLRLLRFEPEARRVVVQTYSPYLDAWKTDPENQFALTLE